MLGTILLNSLFDISFLFKVGLENLQKWLICSSRADMGTKTMDAVYLVNFIFRLGFN